MTYALPQNIDSRPVTIIGGGTLGRRIALMLADRGGTVRIFDLIPEVRDAAKSFVEDQLPAVVERFTAQATQSGRDAGFAIGTVETFDDMATAVSGSWLIIEAVPEKLDLKTAILGQLDELADADAIIGTNSSSYASGDLIGKVTHRERVLNTHFYMPPLQNALDIMSDGETAPEVIDFVKQTLPRFGLFPFEARQKSTGFIFNRIWAAIKRESLDVVAEGVALPEDVDGMWRVNLGTPVGPFQLMDQVGLDIVLDIEKHYVAERPELGTKAIDLVQRYVDAGTLGRKTGAGFYDYSAATPVARPVLTAEAPEGASIA